MYKRQGPISARIIAHQKEEWRLPRGVTGPIVMCELRNWEMLRPVRLIVISDEPKISLEPLIGAPVSYTHLDVYKRQE